MRKKSWLVSAAMVICLSLYGSKIVGASDLSMADKLKQSMSSSAENSDPMATTSKSDSEQESETETEKDDGTQGLSEAWKNLSAAQIVTGIKELDVDDPDIRKVRALRISYNKLGTSTRVNVTNIEDLSKAETKLGIDENGDPLSTDGTSAVAAASNDAKASPDTLQGRNYGFDASSNMTPFTLVLNYISDENNDGAMDVPQIAITSPDGESMGMSEKINSITDTDTEIGVTWTARYMQLDIKQAMSGQWAIATSVPVVFQKRSYAGGALTPITEAAPEPETDPLRVEEEVTTVNPVMLLVRLGVGIGAVAIVLILFIYYIKKLFPAPPAPDENGKLAGARLEADDLEDEIERLRREIAAEKEVGDRQDDDYRVVQEQERQRQEELARRLDRDSDVGETVEDEGIEEMEHQAEIEIATEHVGDTALLNRGGTSQRKKPDFNRFH